MHDIKKPAVSVCIPVFNGAEFIYECIQSVLTQSFEDIELLIVDNASTDNTIDICSAFSDRRMRIHRGVSNIGAHANFKKCFELARSELVILLPCDDLLEPGSLAALAPPLLAIPDAGMAFGRTKVIDSAGETLSEPSFAESGFLSPEQALCFIADKFNPIQHPLVRKTYYFEQGGFQKKYGCFLDIPLWISITCSSKAIYLAPDATTSIRQHPAQGQNIISNMNSNNLASVAIHFGNRSLKHHQYRASYNLCFLRFAKLFERLNTEYGVQSGNSVKILTLLIRSNIHHSLKAILRGNIDQLSLELLVCKKIYFKFKKISVLLIYSKEVVLLLRNLPLRMGRMVFIKLNRKSNLQKN
jgi:glycosyltransferase involved in cell wall biosynthesis